MLFKNTTWIATDEYHLDSHYFEELRNRIHRRLNELRLPGWETQIKDYPWLYGALGCVPASVMFICQNPSLKPMQSAHTNTIDGGPPDIEAQWWGGERNNAAKRFRFALHETGLKTTPPSERGGWNCYITNMVKEANITADQRTRNTEELRRQARRWCDILEWELSQVKPLHVICVGGNATKNVATLQRKGYLPSFRVHSIWHYSAQSSDDLVRQRMIDGIRSVIGTDP